MVDRPAPPHEQALRASRGFFVVLVAALAFFGFVIGSGLLGALGQSLIAFVFACAGLGWLWVRLGPVRRQRLATETRTWLRGSPRHR
jgi:hypothetical protein